MPEQSKQSVFPPDASPLRKLHAAAMWEHDSKELVRRYRAEALAAGVPKKLIDHVVRSASGKADFDLFLWQETLPWLSPKEQKTSIDALMRHKPGQADPDE